MTTFTLRLKDKQIVAKDTMSFIFEKPNNFVFKAGQFGDFKLINPKETDEEGNIRTFSLASPPYEKDLMIATRMRSTAFKRVLKNLVLGTELQIDGPQGSFVLHQNKNIPAVFIAGGIGITPVQSIVLQAAKDKLPHHILLFYSNHTPEDAAFLEELKSLEKENSNYKFIPVITKPDQNWNGEKGHIDKNMLSKYIEDLTVPIFYISGPPSMVSSMRQTLIDSGVSEDNIRSEEFSGY